MPELPMPPRRPRRGRRILFLFLGFAALAAAAALLFIWFSSSALDRMMAELDRDDPGWRFEEIQAKRRVIPDAQNSALQVLIVRGLQGAQSALITIDIEPVFANLPPQTQLNEQQTTLLSKRFATVKQAVEEARKLKDMPDGRFPTKFSADFRSTPLDVREAWPVMNLLKWDAAILAQSLEADAALQSCLGICHTARAIDDDLSPSGALVRNAGNTALVRCDGNMIFVIAMERTLAQAPFTKMSEEALERVQQAISRELSEPRLLNAIRGTRAGVHRYFEAVSLGDAKPGMLTRHGRLPSYVPGFNQYHHTVSLRFYTSLVNAIRLGQEQSDREFRTIGSKSQDWEWTRELLPQMRFVRDIDRQSQACLRCASAALAAERFRIGRDRWPDSLQELVKADLLDSVPTDPYDHKPIRLKRTFDGLIIYSTGPDKIDNGGVIDRDRPTDPGKDIGFQLWDVTARRQPPNPPVAGIDLKE